MPFYIIIKQWEPNKALASHCGEFAPDLFGSEVENSFLQSKGFDHQDVPIMSLCATRLIGKVRRSLSSVSATFLIYTKSPESLYRLIDHYAERMPLNLHIKDDGMRGRNSYLHVHVNLATGQSNKFLIFPDSDSHNLLTEAFIAFF